MPKNNWELEEKYNTLVDKYKDIEFVQQTQGKTMDLILEMIQGLEKDVDKAGDLAYGCSTELMKWVDVIESFKAYLKGKPKT